MYVVIGMFLGAVVGFVLLFEWCGEVLCLFEYFFNYVLTGAFIGGFIGVIIGWWRNKRAQDNPEDEEVHYD